MAKLHPDVVKAFNANKINLQTAKELTNVKQDPRATCGDTLPKAAKVHDGWLYR